MTASRHAPDKETAEAFLVLMAPFAPHFAEELWQRTGHEPTVFRQKWPAWDERYTTADSVEIAVQINGKTRGTIVVRSDAVEDAVVEAALKDAAIQRFLDGKQVRKRVFVRGRILNLIVG
jgi:leucyl-tRNA synthetase